MDVVFENERGRYLTVTKMADREDEVWFTADIGMAKVFTATIRHSPEAYNISIEPLIPVEVLRHDLTMVPVTLGVSISRATGNS